MMNFPNVNFWGKWVGAQLSTQVHAAYGNRHIAGAEEFAQHVWASHPLSDLLAHVGSVSANRTVFNAGIQDEYAWFYAQRPAYSNLPAEPPRALPGTGPEDAPGAGLSTPGVEAIAQSAADDPNDAPTEHKGTAAIILVAIAIVGIVLVAWRFSR